MVPLPAASVVSVVVPRMVSPSPLPDASQAVFEKNWIVNCVFAVLFSVAETPPVTAVSTGKFCRLFAPVSVSPGSFGVTPLLPRSMPRRPLPAIVFARIALPLPLMIVTPLVPFDTIRLPSAAVLPPMVLLELSMTMPSFWLPRALPVALLPIQLPAMTLPGLLMNTPTPYSWFPEMTFRAAVTDPPTVLPDDSMIVTPPPRLGIDEVPAALVPMKLPCRVLPVVWKIDTPVSLPVTGLPKPLPEMTLPAPEAILRRACRWPPSRSGRRCRCSKRRRTRSRSGR